MSNAAREDGSNVPHEQLSQQVVAEEAGYFYIYLSNESNTGSDAFFDDFSIQVSESFIVQQIDYYPYGMVAKNWTRVGDKATKDLFQGKTYEDLTKWYDFHARQYDASLGRWFGVDPQDQFASPYLAMGNNPVMGVDPDGELVWFIPIAVGIISGGINVAASWGAIQAAGGGWAAVGAAASSFGVGFAAGAASTIGAAALAPIILPALGTGFLGGAALGAVGGGIGGFISGAGNTWLKGGSFGQGMAAGGIGIAAGAGFGALTGGTFSGLKSIFQGRDFWTGAIKNFRQPTLNLNQSNVNVNQNFPAKTAAGVEPQVAGRGPGGAGNLGGGGNGSNLGPGSYNLGGGDFKNLGLRSFTEGNFRYNLIKLTGGVDPGTGYQAHHVIPKEFVKEAARLGINVNNPANGMFLNTNLHTQIHSQGYNDMWRQFFKSNPQTAQDVYKFGQGILQHFKIF